MYLFDYMQNRNNFILELTFLHQWKGRNNEIL